MIIGFFGHNAKHRAKFCLKALLLTVLALYLLTRLLDWVWYSTNPGLKIREEPLRENLLKVTALHC